ncbi:MAG: restriction endonuclease subunit S, partial [Ruthenibacterium sp.]
AAQPKLNQNNLNNIKIPIPPLSEQQRIVDILDRFDTLCNDISNGLPAEIKARQQQYEYYRDKLLTFKNIAEQEA